MDYFYEVATGLGTRLGPVLFQLPPNLKKDAALLEHFTESLPASMQAAFEFRHQSWLDEEVFALLRKRNVCLCIADTDKLQTPQVATADWGYLRLRREEYQPDDVNRWADVVKAQRERWSDVFVYFKHEEAGIGPKLATQMRQVL